jgi:hypothetical protein
MTNLNLMNEANYACDHRVRARERGAWFDSFDPNTMIATVKLARNEDCIELPHEIECLYVVCPTCRGKGTHVNPSVDAGGLSPRDFADDDEFRDDYFAGIYDVPCYECKGERVIPEPVKNDATYEIITALAERASEDALYESERESERRMGC